MKSKKDSYSKKLFKSDNKKVNSIQFLNIASYYVIQNGDDKY